MDEYNFDALKNIEVPSEALQAALDIPSRKQENQKPFCIKPGFLAGTAAAMLMLIVGLTLYLNIFKNTPGVINSENITSQTVTGENGEVKIITDENGETHKPSGKSAEENNQSASASYGGSYEAQNQSGTPGAPGSYASNTKPSGAGASSSARNQVTTGDATEPSQNTSAATQKPDSTTPQTSGEGDNTEPCVFPSELPGEPDDTEPEIPPPTALPGEYFAGSLSTLLPLNSAQPVYCNLYRYGGDYIGSIRAKIAPAFEGVNKAEVNPLYNGFELTPGDYKAVFEDGSGNIICNASFTVTYWNINSSFMF